MYDLHETASTYLDLYLIILTVDVSSNIYYNEFFHLEIDIVI